MAMRDSFIHVSMHRGASRVIGEWDFSRGHTIGRRTGGAEDGVFAMWRWDGQRLVVQTDRYGASPLFYWTADAEICISPSLLSLVRCGAPTQLNWEGLAAFLRLGYFLGDDTPFTAIRTVPPGGRLEWENGHLAHSGGRPRIAVTRATRDQAIDGFISLCRQAVHRRFPSSTRVTMPLSGGRDSRHILFELQAAGVRPHCITIPRYPPRPAEDERIAPLVAAALDLPHTVLRQNPSRCEAEMKKNWETHLCADEHAWYMGIVEAVRGRADVIYDGLGGALSAPNRYHSFEALQLLQDGRTRELATRLIAAFGARTESFLRRVLRPAAYAAMGPDVAQQRLARELATHIGAPDPIKSFNFWNRVRRELALTPYALLREVPTVYTPYLDHDLFDFLMGLPPTVMSRSLSDGKAFHTDAIHRAFPQYAHLPFEDKRAAPRDATAHNVRFTADAGRSLLKHAHIPMQLLNRAYVLPRALGATLSLRWGATRSWFAIVSLYLMQLELAAGGRIAAVTDSGGLSPRPWQAA